MFTILIQIDKFFHGKRISILGSLLGRSRENKHGGQLPAPGAAGDGDFWGSLGGQVQETRREVRGQSDQHPPSVGAGAGPGPD